MVSPASICIDTVASHPPQYSWSGGGGVTRMGRDPPGVAEREPQKSGQAGLGRAAIVPRDSTRPRPFPAAGRPKK